MSSARHSTAPQYKLLTALLRDPVRCQKQIAADNKLIYILKQPQIDLAALEAALDEGANPDRVVMKGYPALHVAILRQSAEAVKLLLRYDADIFVYDPQGRLPQEQALLNGFTAGQNILADALSTQQGTPDEDTYQDMINTEVLQAAIDNRRPARELAAAIALGGHVNVTTQLVPPLLLAAAAANEEKVDILLRAGAVVPSAENPKDEILRHMWNADKNRLFSDEWFRIYDKLVKKGAGDLFTRHPLRYTLADLREPLGLAGEFGQRTRFMHLALMDKFDYLVAVIAADKKNHVTINDFLVSTTLNGKQKTLLDVMMEAGRLDDFLTPEIWGTRVADLERLRPYVMLHSLGRREVDFDAALQRVRDYRQSELTKQSRPRPAGLSF